MSVGMLEHHRWIGMTAVPKCGGEEGAEPEGETMSGDQDNKVVDRLLAAEMSFPLQGV